MTSVNILSAALKNAMCNYSYEILDGVGEGDIINRKGSSIVHSDLIRAFRKLDVHLALICEEIDKSSISDIEHFENMKTVEFEDGTIEKAVSAFTANSVKTDKSGVTVTGTKELSTGDHVTLQSPKVDWDDDYQFLGELKVVVDEIQFEVEEYMNGKKAPEYVQQELSFETETDQFELSI